MSRPGSKTNPKHLFRALIPLLLTIFLMVQSQLSQASSRLQSTQLPPQYTEGLPGQTDLCGKLVFVKDLKTNATLLGLKTCSNSEILIFDQRPAELFNNYEFYGVTIEKGPRLATDHGDLNKYITGFINYRQIPDCSFCGKAVDIAPPTFTPPPAVTPPVAVTEAAPPLGTEVAEVESVAALPTSQCITGTAQIVAQAMGFPKYQFLIDQSSKILDDAPLDVCGGDPNCETIVYHKTLVGGMVVASFEASPGPRPVGQIIGAFARWFDDGSIKTACNVVGAMAWEGFKQFSIKGIAIDGFAIHSPADLRVRDFEAKESGFYSNGQVKQDIPESLTRKDGESQYVFLPGGKAKDVEFAGTGDGAMTMEAVRSSGAVVQELAYDQTPVDATTQGYLNTTSAPRTKLEITASSSGAASLDPTRFEEFAIVASVAPVTATPTQTTTPTATPTPAGFKLEDSQLWIGLILVVCVVALLALLGIGLIYYFFIRNRTT